MNIIRGPKGRATNGARKAWLDQYAISWESDDCLLSPFTAGSHGYVSFKDKGKWFLSHRYICEKAHGAPVSINLDCAHSCGHRLCVNKRHLRWATRIENALDTILHGRTTRGEKHPGIKLTNDIVITIRADNRRQSDIAATYGIAQQTVSDIKCRRRWEWL